MHVYTRRSSARRAQEAQYGERKGDQLLVLLLRSASRATLLSRRLPRGSHPLVDVSKCPASSCMAQEEQKQTRKSDAFLLDDAGLERDFGRRSFAAGRRDGLDLQCASREVDRELARFKKSPVKAQWPPPPPAPSGSSPRSGGDYVHTSAEASQSSRGRLAASSERSPRIERAA